MQLVHLASRLYGTPLLIARSKLDVILAVLGSRIGLPESEAQMALPSPRAAHSVRASGDRRHSGARHPGASLGGVDAASGLTSYSELGARLDAALADPQVDGILLDIDSPGGEAGGVFELAAPDSRRERRKARLGARQRLRPTRPPTRSAPPPRASRSRKPAGVGSIGVIALHVDQSVKDAKDGSPTPRSTPAATRTTSPRMRRSHRRRQPPCRSKSIASTRSSWGTWPKREGLKPKPFAASKRGSCLVRPPSRQDWPMP